MPTDDQQDPQAPQDDENTAPVEQTPTEPVKDDQEGENPDAAGSKAKVLEDLAKERRDRKAAQTLAQ